jgi:thioester reductase-like protein
MDEKKDAVLITGAGGFLGQALLERMYHWPRPLWLLCRPGSVEKLKKILEKFPGGNFRIICGDIEQPGLGLSEPDRAEIRKGVTDIFHLAARYHLSAGEEEAFRANLEGTRRVLELAQSIGRLRRLHYVSTMAVAGDYAGQFRPEDLDLGQNFHHHYGRSKFEAERLVRSAREKIPITIYRPGVIMGDSRTGWALKIDGPYYVFRALANFRKIPGARRLPMFVPREKNSCFHLVAVDFVADALLALGESPDTVGSTFHLMDPAPPTFRDFYIATLRSLGFEGPLIPRPLSRLIRLMCRPGVWPLTRRVMSLAGMPAEMLPHFLYTTTYETDSTMKLLGAAGISCPPFERVLPVVVEYFEKNMLPG